MTIAKRQRRSFPEDFKREAVALITEQSYKVSEAARSLDVHENLLRKWKRRFEQEAGGGILTADEREELIRLRRENRELRMEKEILKKASAYFARQMK
jgi:transposase